LLGYYLIITNENFQNIFIKHLEELHQELAGLNKQDYLKLIIKTWFVTSIFHDCAYSISTIEQWLGSYFAIAPLSLPLPLVVNLNKIWVQYEREKVILTRMIANSACIPDEDVAEILKEMVIEASEKKGREPDHGVIGSLILMKALEDLREEQEEVMRREACCAISLHNKPVFEEIKKRGPKTKMFNLREQPFSFLLVFCDNVQEWGRIFKATDLIPQKLPKLDSVIFERPQSKSGPEVIVVKLCYKGTLGLEDQDRIRNNLAIPTSTWHALSELQFRVHLLHAVNNEKQEFDRGAWIDYPILQEN